MGADIYPSPLEPVGLDFTYALLGQKARPQGARCGRYRDIGKPSNAADALCGCNPKGRERFGRGSALLALAIVALLPRAPALNHVQIAPRRIREIKSDRLLTGH